MRRGAGEYNYVFSVASASSLFSILALHRTLGKDKKAEEKNVLYLVSPSQDLTFIFVVVCASSKAQ